MVHDGHAGHPLHAIAWPAVEAARRNVELKARDPDPAATLARALAAGAEDRGVLHQRDTYFAVAHGRLKLREEEPGGATLIAYDRPDAGADRVSAYRLVPVPDPAALRAALAGACGVRVEVAKRRRLLLWETVRIHLDEVAGLGSFLELEAVAAAGSDLERERAQVEHLRGALAIRDAALTEGSYADAVARGRGRRRRARGPEARARAPSAVRGGARPRAPRAGPRRRPQRLRAVLPLPRRRRGAHHGRPPLRRRQRRERRLPAGPVRGGLRARGDGGRRRRHGGRGRRGRPEPRAVHAVRRLPPAAARVHAARTRRSTSPTSERVRRTTSLAELLPLSFGPEHLAP